MTILVFCLEEPSAKAMLEGILPRILPIEFVCRYIVFEGKQDMHKQLVRKLRHWQEDNSYFIVMRDQDRGDCKKIKNDLFVLCKEAGRNTALIRIVCHELESFYLGDLDAVEAGLGVKNIASQKSRAKFRNPDNLVNAADELKKITQNKYQKLSGSRSIGTKLLLDGENKSTSFRVLISGIKRICDLAVGQ